MLSASTPFLVATGKKQLTLKKGTHISLNKRDDPYVVSYMNDTPIPMSQTLSGGNDYYIYLVTSNENIAQFVVSLNATYPTGYTATNSRKIGGFHTLCADVGTIADHPLSGYQAGDILPNSVWCLNHRPYSSPEGMVYVPCKDIWVDIYLQSGTGENTRSAYNVPVTTNRPYTDHVTDMMRVKKSLLSDEEFCSAMYGSNDKTAIKGKQAPSPKTAGGHVDTSNRRMISHIGCEEGCGYLFQYLSGGFPMHTATRIAGRDQIQTQMSVLVAGGSWSNDGSSGCFTRLSRNMNSFSEQLGARGCSRPRCFI